MATTQFVARNGLIALSDSTISGSLFVSQSVTATSFTGAFSGSLTGTASYASDSNLFDGKDSSTFATTGSNTFIGNQTVTGSLFTSGSNTLIGDTTLSGSFNVSGSTLQQGNNTLIGNTQLSGSIGISGSSTIQGITTMSGSLLITGSTTQIGTNTLQGNTLLSGSIIISGAYTPGSPTASVQIYGDIKQSGYHRFDPVITNIDTSISASYIYVSGSTQDLYFSQNGNGYNNVTRLRWLEGNMYTGLLNGGIITQVNSNTYQISSGSGIIVSLNASYSDNPYPTVQYLNWGNLTRTIDSLSSSFDQQFVAIDNTATIYAQGIPYTDGDYNTKIPIGIVIHQNHSSINAVQTFPSTAYGFKQRTSDFVRAFGPLKISGYSLSPSSSLGLLLSGGTAFVDGRNYIVDPNNPSYITEASGITTSKVYRYYQSGSANWIYNTNAGAGYTTIDPTQYSNAGVLTPLLNNNKWSIQRVYYFPNSATKAFYIYYGNAQYDTKTDAKNAIASETFNEAPNTTANAIFIGYMLLQKVADFTTPTTYEFISAGLFRSSGVGGSGGAGGGVTNLAGLTDVQLSTLSYGDLLMYDTTHWYNTKTLSGSYAISGSLIVDNGITSSLFGTASWATNATTASYITPLSQSVGITGSFFIIGQNTNVVSQDSYKTNDFFLVRNSTTTLKVNTGVEVSSSAAIPFRVATDAGANLLFVSQSGMVVIATSSVLPEGPVPYGAFLFTSGALWIGID